MPTNVVSIRLSRFCELDEAAFEMLTSMKDGCTLVTLAPEKTSTEHDHGLPIRVCWYSVATVPRPMSRRRWPLQAGMRGFTHLFNAMSPFEARAPGMVGAALHDRNSWFGIIADGQHVHPAAFAVAVAAKHKGRALLVTDAMATVGSDIRHFTFDGSEITVADGSCRTKAGRLAGSSLDMISAVRNAARFAELKPSEALRMASNYPAHALGLENELGQIRPGYKASFVEVDENLNLYRTWIDGEVSEAAL